MKVIIVTPYVYPHAGGVEVYTLHIAKELKRLGWEVVFVTIAATISGAPVTLDGMKVYYLRPQLMISNTPVGLGWRRQLARIFRAEQPDVVNAHTPVPYLADMAARACGRIPFVLTYHNDVEKESPWQSAVIRVMYALLVTPTLRRSNVIVVTSDEYIGRSRYLRGLTERIRVVPPGVTLAVFHPGVETGELARRYRNKRVILFVGSLNKRQQYKGLDIVIQAFRQVHLLHPETRLVLAGEGDGRDMYLQQARQAGVADATEFVGFVEHALLAAYYKIAKLLVMASTSHTEGFGMVFMEASAVGTPVVGTRVGGVASAIVHDQTGLVTEPKSVKGLHDAMVSILTDNQLARRLGKAGHKRATSQFNWQLQGERTDQILVDAIKPAIVQVTGFYPPHLGGMERVAQSLSEGLAARGYAVTVITSDADAPSEPEAEVPGLRVRRLASVEFAHTPVAFWLLPAMLRVPKRSILHLHLGQAYYPELTWLVSKLRGVPYILHFHLDLQPTGRLGKVFVLYKRIVLRAVVTQASRIVVFSDEQREFIHTEYGVSRDVITVIPNGVGSEYFLGARTYAQAKLTHSLLYVGRLSGQKRVRMLIEMMAHLDTKFTLTIVGDGEERETLRQLAIDLGLRERVTFAGKKDPAETVAYYKAADVFVMSSENEGMPLVMLEAMAAGLPVVGASVPGIRELISGVGMLVEAPSGANFARVITEVFANCKRMSELSRASSEAATKYSWVTLTDAFEKLYAAVTS